MSLRPVGCVSHCRVCRYIDVSDEVEIEKKVEWLQKQFALWPTQLRALAVDYPRLGRRDKITLQAKFLKDQWQFGITQNKKIADEWEEEFVALVECPVHSARINSLLKVLAELPPALPLGLVSISGAQVTLVLKANERDCPGAPDIMLGFWAKNEAALKNFGAFGLWINWNPVLGTWLTLHKGWRYIAGEKRSRHVTGEWYGPGGFGQVHWPLYQKALARMIEYLRNGGPRSYLELYCGLGGGLAKWSGHVEELLGVELGGESVELANLNAPKAQVLRGTCATRLPQVDTWYQKQMSLGPVAIFVNPPRNGLEAEVLEWLVSQKSKYPTQKLAYLSCSPLSLGGDLKLLEKGGFKVEELLPYDFFPKTRHVETLALLK